MIGGVPLGGQTEKEGGSSFGQKRGLICRLTPIDANTPAQDVGVPGTLKPPHPSGNNQVFSLFLLSNTGQPMTPDPCWPHLN
jgi:hypothetical protein